MEIQVEGIDQLRKRLKGYLRRVKNVKEKTRILAAGGVQVRKVAAQSPTPKSSKVHYYYSKKGGKIPITPGNLRRSMKVYKGKEGDVFIGPHVLRRVAGLAEIGRTQKTASGYYAAALYGSAARFRQMIMETALDKSSPAALRAIEKAYKRYHDKISGNGG